MTHIPETISDQLVEAAIKGEEWQRFDRTIIYVLTLQNDFKVIGKSGCISPARFEITTGKEIARRDAIRQCYMLLGFQLASEKAEWRLTPDDRPSVPSSQGT